MNRGAARNEDFRTANDRTCHFSYLSNNDSTYSPIFTSFTEGTNNDTNKIPIRASRSNDKE